MKDNSQYAKWKKQCPQLTPEWLMKMWVQLAWPTMIDSARAILAEMLNRNYPDSLKDDIADALIKDATLRPGKIVTQLVH